MKNHAIQWLLLAASALMVSACLPNASQPKPPPQPTPESDAQGEDSAAIANPASTYCVENGGRLEIRDEPAGQVGYCIFPDGVECEEWAYLRGKCTPGGLQPAGVPRVVVPDYKFSINPPEAWAVEGSDHLLSLKLEGRYALRIGYRWQDEAAADPRGELPPGELREAEGVLFRGQTLEKSELVFAGKVRQVRYGYDIPDGELRLTIWLEALPQAGQDDAGLELPAEVIRQAEEILQTFARTAG